VRPQPNQFANRWTAREARTIMERKSTAARVTDRREAGAGPSGQTYFRSSVRSFLGSQNQ